MSQNFTVLMLVAAGISLVMQNLLMVRITETASTVLVTLAINSGVGLTLLLGLLLWRSGLNGISETFGALRPWSVLPGVLGSFFVFAGICGYQRLGAASTIAVLVASQLVAGVLVDSYKESQTSLQSHGPTILGCILLIAGAILVMRRTI